LDKNVKDYLVNEKKLRLHREILFHGLVIGD